MESIPIGISASAVGAEADRVCGEYFANQAELLNRCVAECGAYQRGPLHECVTTVSSGTSASIHRTAGLRDDVIAGALVLAFALVAFLWVRQQSRS